MEAMHSENCSKRKKKTIYLDRNNLSVIFPCSKNPVEGYVATAQKSLSLNYSIAHFTPLILVFKTGDKHRE